MQNYRAKRALVQFTENPAYRLVRRGPDAGPDTDGEVVDIDEVTDESWWAPADGPRLALMRA
jgi:hypothetical protein